MSKCPSEPAGGCRGGDGAETGGRGVGHAAAALTCRDGTFNSLKYDVMRVWRVGHTGDPAGLASQASLDL